MKAVLVRFEKRGRARWRHAHSVEVSRDGGHTWTPLPTRIRWPRGVAVTPGDMLRVTTRGE